MRLEGKGKGYAQDYHPFPLPLLPNAPERIDTNEGKKRHDVGIPGGTGINNNGWRNGIQKCSQGSSPASKPFFSNKVNQSYRNNSQERNLNCGADRRKACQEKRWGHHVVIKRSQIHFPNRCTRTYQKEVPVSQ